jgi:hypothetical protein
LGMKNRGKLKRNFGPKFPIGQGRGKKNRKSIAQELGEYMIGVPKIYG